MPSRHPAGRRIAAAVALLAQAVLFLQLIDLAVFRTEELILLLATMLLLGKAAFWALIGRPAKRWAAVVVGILAAVGLAAQWLIEDPGTIARHLALLLTSAIFLIAVWWVRSTRGGGSLQALTVVPAPGPANTAILLINPHSGGGRTDPATLEAAARTLGIDTFVLPGGGDLAAIAERACTGGYDTVGIASGDGSLGVVAAAAMRHGLRFVCIPIGTLNHFARDLGLDRDDPIAALASFHGEERRIDACRAGERVFLNNASFGIYAEIVHQPDYRENRVEAVRRVFASFAAGERNNFDLRFRTPDGRVVEGAFVLLAGNNRYDFLGLHDFGERSRLDDGFLDILALESGDPDTLERLADSLLLAQPGPDWMRWDATRLVVESNRGRVLAGVDGEAVEFDTPLTIEVLPGALRVLTPVGTPAQRPHAPPPFSAASIAELLRVAAGRDQSAGPGQR